MSRPKTSEMKIKILGAVEKLIAENGVNDISLQDIAKKCNISKGTLYYHYSSKDDIILDIIIKHIKELENEYLLWLNRHKDDMTPTRFLSVVLYKGVKLFDRAKMHIFIINECIRDNTKLRDKYVELWMHWKETLKMGLDNVFINNKNNEALSNLLMLVIDGLVVQEVLNIKSSSNDEIISLIVKVGEKY